MGLGNFELSERVIAAAIRVHKELGPGFLESMYEEALAIELADAEITFERQNLLPIFYREAGSKTSPTIVLLHGFPRACSHYCKDLLLISRQDGDHRSAV